jgi:quercetin dioxygenase-like cupin family protein
MPKPRFIAFVLTTLLAVVAAVRPVAQSRVADPVWETLQRAPLPADVDPIISINSLALPAGPRVTQAHTHPGPVVAYIVKGEIENQVEPDPPAIYKADSFFYEPPMRVHKMLRNLSTTEPATLIICQVGRTRVPESLLKPLEEGEAAQLLQSQHQWQVPLRSTLNQELRVFRLTIPAGARAESRSHTGPGLVYVLEGTITASARSVPMKTYRAGDLFFDPAYRAELAFRNANTNAPAKLLLYHVSEHAPPSAP